MYCSNCGKLIMDDAKFCSYCGTRIADLPAEETVVPAAEDTPVAQQASAFEQAPAAKEEMPSAGTVQTEPLVEEVVETVPSVDIPAPQTEPVSFTEKAAAKPAFDDTFSEFRWNVDEYPDRNSNPKTEDIDFDWNADPATIFTGKGIDPKNAAEIRVKADMIESGEAQFPTEPSADDGKGDVAARIDQFYTINKKNAEFQQLLNKEYEKVKSGNTIGDELDAAEKIAEEKFESMPEDNSMEAFLEREGVEKPYEPKAFETDVLKKIDAQEKAKERKRLEDEAREKALEEARREAANKMKAEEEARRNFEAAEAARIRSVEEARARAEAEAKAESDLKAQQEAELIRQQAEAREAAEAQAKAKAEEERRRYEAARLEEKRSLERQEQNRQTESQNAAAEARRVLEQTTRMREEEAAKIRAAIAGLRGEVEAQEAQAAPSAAAETQAPAAAETVEVPAPEMPAATEIPAVESPAAEAAEAPVATTAPEAVEAPAPVFAETVVPNPLADLVAEAEEPVAISEPIVEAPVQQVNSPYAPSPYAPPAEPAAEPILEPVIEPVAEPAAENVEILQFTPTAEETAPAAAPAAPVTEVPSDIEAAHQATRDQINDMAKARDTYFATFYGEESLESQMRKAAMDQQATPAAAQAPAPAEASTPAEAAASAEDLTKTRVIDKSAILSGLETTRRLAKAELTAQEDKGFFESLENAKDGAAAEARPMELKEEGKTVDELLNQFEAVNSSVDPLIADLPDAASEEAAPAAAEGYAVKEEPSVMPAAGFAAQASPGLTDTMIMPGRELETSMTEEFDNYGVEEAENYRRQQAQAMAGAQQQAQAQQPVQQPVQPAAPAAVQTPVQETAGYSRPQQTADDEDAEAERKSGGAGRLILKIILIILIVIFAAELLGITIKFVAPQSGAAEMIDTQLNKVIHLITG